MVYENKDCDVKFHDLYERSASVANEHDISPTKPRSTQRQRHTSNAPIERFEDHYRVNFFLPFIDHTISHLNSRFTQGRKAIFYGNYLVSALVNNVNSEIVNDMKTEYMNDLPYQNHPPQEGDRWVAKCICCNLQILKFLMLTLTCTQMFM